MLNKEKRTAKVLAALVLTGLLAGVGSVAEAAFMPVVNKTEAEEISENVEIVNDGTDGKNIALQVASAVTVSYTGEEIKVTTDVTTTSLNTGDTFRGVRVYGGRNNASLTLGGENTASVIISNVIDVPEKTFSSDGVWVGSKGTLNLYGKTLSVTSQANGTSATAVNEAAADAVVNIGTDNTETVTLTAENSSDSTTAHTYGIAGKGGTVTVKGQSISITSTTDSAVSNGILADSDAIISVGNANTKNVSITSNSDSGTAYGIESKGKPVKSGESLANLQNVSVLGQTITVKADGKNGAYAISSESTTTSGTIMTDDPNTVGSTVTNYYTGKIVVGDSDTEQLTLKVASENGEAIAAQANGKDSTLSLLGKEIEISAEGNVIRDDGNVAGVYAVNGGSAVVGDSDTETIDVTVANTNTDGMAVGIFAGKQAETVTVAGDTLNVTAKGDGSYGILAQNVIKNDTSFATVNVNTQHTVVTSDAAGLVAMSHGKLYANSGDVKVTAKDAVLTRGDAVLQINAEKNNYKIQLDGDVDFVYDEKTSGTETNADVTINLVGEDSYWNGNAKISWDSKPENVTKLSVSSLKLGLYDGATWNAEYIGDKDVEEDGWLYMPVNTLTIGDGVVNAKAEGQTLSVDTLVMTEGEINVDNGTFVISESADIGGGTITAKDMDVSGNAAAGGDSIISLSDTLTVNENASLALKDEAELTAKGMEISGTFTAEEGTKVTAEGVTFNEGSDGSSILGEANVKKIKNNNSAKKSTISYFTAKEDGDSTATLINGNYAMKMKVSEENGDLGFNSTEVTKNEDGTENVVTKEVAVLDKEGNFGAKSYVATEEGKETIVQMDAEGLTIFDSDGEKTLASYTADGISTSGGNFTVDSNGKVNAAEAVIGGVVVGDDSVMANTGIFDDTVSVANGLMVGGDIDLDGKTGTITAKNLTLGGKDVATEISGMQASIQQNASGISNLNSRVNRLGNEIDSVGAISSALAGLHPLDYDGSESRFQIAAAVGTYDGMQAGALGAFYHVNEDIMLSLGGSTSFGGDRKTAANLGVTFRVGQSGAKLSRSDARELEAKNRALEETVAKQGEELAGQKAEIEELKAQVKALVEAGKK